MKLESLKNDKFQAFRENKLQNAFQIVGGQTKKTKYSEEQGGDCDTLDYSTGRSTQGENTPVDYERFEC